MGSGFLGFPLCKKIIEMETGHTTECWSEKDNCLL